MSKLIRRITKDGEEEIVVNETQETETMPVMTSEANVDISEASLGDVILLCNKCTNVLTIGRHLGINLICNKCGSDKFLSKSNFRMEGPDGGIAISVGDTVTRKGRMIWKIV